ncbi:MAG: adenine phosphoribosyltransferase [Firmicutes bacterium]|nr:adenine phosphoribosyltransferase [Bacillota bacterium]
MNLRDEIRVVEDFPEPGISFKDITTLLRNGSSFHAAVDQLVAYGRSRNVDAVVGPEARGFVLGAPVAYALGVGFVPIRKPGKLPGETVSKQYALEYGKDGLELHRDALKAGDRVLVVDDLLATGGTIRSCVELVEQLGATVSGLAFLIELTHLHGRERLQAYDIHSLIMYD